MAAIPPQLQRSTAGLATDTRSLDALRSRANADPKGAVREAAKQFESLFMAELMKSMRATTLKADGEGGSSGAGGMATDMLDQQFATQMSGLPGGLSEAIMKQLERQMGMTPGPIPVTKSANNTPAPLSAQPVPTAVPQTGAAGFVQQHTAAAQRAESETGIPATFMVSQAALETGWGRKEIRHGDGSPSYNLFGIKAGPNWKGATAEVMTTEYINGKPQKVMAKFRAYGSYAESFADYARLMKDSPRYAGVVRAATVASADAGASARAAAGFAQGLQRAGYATDPAYADKLSRVINTTLRLQRSLA
ncbi:flagellar assembly peptidoglycan hydrolase FlgJ [Rubrivivax rivuli]|uniref:Peptidoglycan hydrolase FlgJ n=1 Tax=Rubrivivax rivuli TaxID=1862385 RepID=A0A437RFI3_9BURK|nr:flagellar assembly peptidoglycan hydrolase FlgJ [Rubrivivax rivuli]RVU45527.1 flagellar assembly peptidoglycan hydrolase FlgJ [Rubrivivax rivuli]